MCMFVEIGNEIADLTNDLELLLHSLDDKTISEKRNMQNRNIKQIVGHLIDSASNNTHRVIHLQYQDSPCHFPDYANLGVNDKWIAIQNYNDEDWGTLISLLKYINLHYVHVINNVEKKHIDKEWISALGSKITLKGMIVDYPRHLKLHISEIKELI